MAGETEQAHANPARSIRQWWVLFHRWVGLVLAGFLLLASLTGSLLVWDRELDDWFAHDIMIDPAGAKPAAFDALALHEQVNAAYPHARANYVELQAPAPGHTLQFFLLPAGPKDGPLENDQAFLSPVSGKVVGVRKYAAISQGRKNLMPFIYTLHEQLALGVVGTRIFGIVALLWAIDCFVGAYLTFPVRTKRKTAAKKSWWSRWKPSWLVRRDGGSYKLNMDLHRAGGLWTWAMLFVFAWSAVSFNLASVYDPVMKSAFAFDEREEQLPRAKARQLDPGIPWQEAHRIGQTLMAAEARRLGFTVLEENMLSYDAFRAMYRYSVQSTADVRNQYGDTHIFFDANTGALRLTSLPTGQYAGNTVTNWLEALHMAQVWGLPFRIFICLMGLVITMLSVTGVVIWWKKRKARVHRDALQKQFHGLRIETGGVREPV